MARPGFSFLVSDDSALLKEEIERQIEKYAPEAKNWKRLNFWGDEEPDERFWSSLDQAGLFEEKRLITVRRADQLPAGIWQDISARLARELSHAWPFFCIETARDGAEHKIPAYIQKTPCFAFAEKRKWLWRSSVGRGNLAARIKEQVENRGLTFDREAQEAFQAFAQGAHWQQIVNELEKLSLLANDGKVTASMLDFGAYQQERSAFAVVNAIRAGDLGSALEAAAEDTDGSLLFFAIAVLDRDLRDKWNGAAGAKNQSYRQQGRPLSAPEASRGFVALADAEWKVKSGQLAPTQALEQLCDRLVPLFSR